MTKCLCGSLCLISWRMMTHRRKWKLASYWIHLDSFWFYAWFLRRVQKGWFLIRHSCLVKGSNLWVLISVHQNWLILFMLSGEIFPRASGPVPPFWIQRHIVWLVLSYTIPLLHMCIHSFSWQRKVRHILGEIVLFLVGVGLVGGYAQRLLGVGTFCVGLKGRGACSLWYVSWCGYGCSILCLWRGLAYDFPQRLLPYGQGYLSKCFLGQIFAKNHRVALHIWKHRRCEFLFVLRDCLDSGLCCCWSCGGIPDNNPSCDLAFDESLWWPLLAWPFLHQLRNPGDMLLQNFNLLD